MKLFFRPLPSLAFICVLAVGEFSIASSAEGTASSSGGASGNNDDKLMERFPESDFAIALHRVGTAVVFISFAWTYGHVGFVSCRKICCLQAEFLNMDHDLSGYLDFYELQDHFEVRH